MQITCQTYTNTEKHPSYPYIYYQWSYLRPGVKKPEHDTHTPLTNTHAHAHTHLDGIPPANDEGAVVLPAEATGVHVRPQAHIVTQHVGDSLLGADVINLHSLSMGRRGKHISCIRQ